MKHDKARDSERLTPSEALISFMEDYDLESRVFLNQFPRSERHILSAEIRQATMNCYRVMSFLAYMSHCDGYNTTKHMLKDFILRRSYDHTL